MEDWSLFPRVPLRSTLGCPAAPLTGRSLELQISREAAAHFSPGRKLWENGVNR